MVSQGSRPLTISIRLGGNKERVQTTVPPPQPPVTHKVSQTPSYRHLPSSIIRINYSRSLNSYISKLKIKRKKLYGELSDLRDDSMSSFPLTPDPIRKKCQYDYMLEEMRLVSNDFVEERRWKIHTAYILAHEAQSFFYRYIYPHQQLRGSDVPVSDVITNPVAKDSEEQQKRRIGHMLSEMVQDFWSKVHEANRELSESVPTRTVKPKDITTDDRRLEITMNKQLMRSEYLKEDGKEEGQVSEEVVRQLTQRSDREGMRQYIHQCILQRLPAVVQCNKEMMESVFLTICPILNLCSKGVGMILCKDDFIPAITVILQYLFPHFHLHFSLTNSLRMRDILVLSPSSLKDPKPNIHLSVLMCVDVSIPSQSGFITSSTQVLVIQTGDELSLQSIPYHFNENYTHPKDSSISITTRVITLSPSQQQLRNALLSVFIAKWTEPSQSDLLYSFYLLTRQIDRLIIPPSSPCVMPPIRFCSLSHYHV